MHAIFDMNIIDKQTLDVLNARAVMDMRFATVFVHPHSQLFSLIV